MDGAKSRANYCPEKQKHRFQVLLKGTQMGGGGGLDYVVGTQSNGNSLHFKCQDKVLVFQLPVGILGPAHRLRTNTSILVIHSDLCTVR